MSGLDDFERTMKDYDYHLGLTNDEKVIIESQDPNQLSHLLEYNDLDMNVETWARHMQTGELFISRRRPMCEEERLFAMDRLTEKWLSLFSKD